MFVRSYNFNELLRIIRALNFYVPGHGFYGYRYASHRPFKFNLELYHGVRTHSIYHQA